MGSPPNFFIFVLVKLLSTEKYLKALSNICKNYDHAAQNADSDDHANATSLQKIKQPFICHYTSNATCVTKKLIYGRVGESFLFRNGTISSVFNINFWNVI